MQPRMNETICVIADTCGKASMTREVAKKSNTLLSLHHLLLKEGVRHPMVANRKFDMPTGSEVEKNHEIVAQANGTMMLYG